MRASPPTHFNAKSLEIQGFSLVYANACRRGLYHSLMPVITRTAESDLRPKQIAKTDPEVLEQDVDASKDEMAEAIAVSAKRGK